MSFAVLQHHEHIVHYFYPKPCTICVGSDPIQCELVIPFLQPLHAKIFVLPLPLELIPTNSSNHLETSYDIHNTASIDSLDLLSISESDSESFLQEKKEQVALIFQNFSRIPVKLTANKIITIGQISLLYHGDVIEFEYNSISKTFTIAYHDHPFWTSTHREKILQHWKSLHYKMHVPRESLSFTLVHKLLLQDILSTITNGLSTNHIETAEQLIDALQDIKLFALRKQQQEIPQAIKNPL